MLSSPLGDAVHELIEKGEGKIDFAVADRERRRKRDDILVVSANVEHQAVTLAAVLEISFQRLVDEKIDRRLVGSETVLAADFHTQRQAHAVDVADGAVASLELVEAVEEIRPLERGHALI